MVSFCLVVPQNVILEKKLGFLRTVACLKRMDARKLRKLAAVTTIVRFQVGEVIAVEDDNVEPLQWFMIVKMGEVQVEKRRDELSRRGRMRVVASGPGSRTIAAPPSRRTKLRPLPLCTICAGDVATPITALDHANVKEGARHIATLTARTVVLVAVVSKPDFIARLDPTDHAMIRPYLLSVPSLQETQRLGRERDRWRQYKSQLVRETVAEVGGCAAVEGGRAPLHCTVCALTIMLHVHMRVGAHVDTAQAAQVCGKSSAAENAWKGCAFLDGGSCRRPSSSHSSATGTPQA